ncbi:MFS transporter [Micromonospora auratinigra]|uniref:Predicted arabinose efflux permease, MFS family n=1 Tax=Micromonospora auratinigra TaxID=261654 RepID=A0A1A8ZBI0_9ACTN|nr:MFS transporter [Micromonospora auratinigra]SBT41158.1 Predicted arabinose efflux permease, MFS family [Micromonospora auratinigra]
MVAEAVVRSDGPGPATDPGRAVLARYTATAVLVRLADEGARVALVLLAVEHTGGAGYGGLLVAALMVPHVVAGPVVGMIADTVRRRRLFYCLALLGFAAALLGAALSAAASRALTVVLVLLAGCLAPVMLGGLTGLLRDLAPRRLDTAFGLDATSYNLAGIAGPAIAAVVAGRCGATVATAVLTGLVALGALVLCTLPVADRPVSARHPAARPRPTAAVPLLWRRPRLGAVTLASSVGYLGVGALPVVAVLLAARLHDTAYTGWLLTASSLGGLAGSLWYARFPVRAHPPERVVTVVLALMAVPFALVAFASSPVLALALFVLVGLLNGPLFCAVLAVRDREAPPGVRTQVMTLGAGLKTTAAAAGAVLAGAATGLGAGPLLLGVAACQVLGAAGGAVLLRRAGRQPGAGPSSPGRDGAR